MRVLRWAGRFWTGVLALTVLLAALLLGLRLLLPLLSAPPALLDAAPAAGAAGVSPRARISLRFDGPMNPRSVERAVALAPAVDWKPIWSDDRTTLTISPTAPLRPDSSYQLTISVAALNQRFRALAQPVELRFRTAPAPAVVQVLPPDGAADVPHETPISIRFSRTIVPTSKLMLPTALPELRFDPPLAGSVTWLDQATALFRPDEPLRPGTRYRATIDAALSDIAGGQLDKPFSWSFSTPAPAVLAVAPADGSRLVAPRATIAITLSQPLDLDSLRASLSITPTVEGDLAARDLPDGGQVVLYAPFAGWRPATTYAVTLQAGAAPTVGNLPLLAPRRWSFTTAPQPALTGRFPGEGQTLPAGQEIRLIFNTPVDAEAIRSAIQLTPAASLLRVAASDTEVRIAADVRAATAYTITLPATLADRNGIPLGQEYRLRFVTAPSGPALALPEAPDHRAQALPGQPAGLLLRRTNLSALNFDLYQLDEAAVVRTVEFQDGDWSLFQPERYGQPLLRSWSMALADQLNTPVDERVPLTTDSGAPLPAGAYYLRIRTPEGPRADLLLLISRTRLTLQSSGGAALVWATDAISGTPIGALPVALYQSGALVEQGATDANGLARFTRAASVARPTDVALARGGERIGVVSSAWGAASLLARDHYQVFLTTDRAAYRPGERIAFAGVVRASDATSGTLALPQEKAIGLSVRPSDAAGRIYQQDLKIGATGLFSAGLTLPADAPPGTYTVAAAIDGATFQTTFAVQPAASPPLQVAVQTPPPLAAGAPAPLAVEVRTPEGWPVAGAAISWTLDAERAPFAAFGDYIFGDAERTPLSAAPRTGTGQTDADGRFAVAITDTVAADVPLRYRLAAQATEPGGPSATAQGEFLVAPAPIYAGVRLPSRIFAAGRAGPAELLALMPDGRPAPRTNLRVEVYRRTWERSAEPGAEGALRPVWRPRDKLAFTRGAVTGDDGTASLSLALPAGGAYRLRVSAAGSPSSGSSGTAGQMYSATTLWAAAPGFTNWGELPGDQPMLIADRDDYRPGDTATLLLTAPFAQSPVLIARGAAGGVEGQTYTIRAGEPFTLTLRPEDAPALPIAVLFAGRPRLGSTAGAPPPPLLATATLPVQSDRARLAVALAADAETYAPGATATLTVTTTDASGAGAPADVILSLTGASAASQATIADAFLAPPPALSTAPVSDTQVTTIPAAAPAADRPPLPRAAPGVYWNPALRTNASGVLTLTVQLPEEPAELRAQAWAASADRFGQARSTLAVTRPIELAIEAPPLFRAGDTVELAAQVENTSAAAQEIQVGLSFAGVRLLDDAATQRAVVPAGGRTRFVWRALVMDVAGVSLNISARAAGATPQFVQIEQPILPAGPLRERGGAALVEGRYTQVFTTSLERGGGQLTIDVAASSRALALDAAHSLAAAPERSLLDEAALLLITAPLSDTQPLAGNALARLLKGQNDDGGWGWWPRGRSEPFVTATALEALAAARAAGLGPPADAIEGGLARLQAALTDRATRADQRAHILYALSRYDQADPAALLALAADPAALGPPGLAYLLLARPAQAAWDAGAALDRLAALASREDELASWPASRDDTTLDTNTSTTALALLALERARPGDELLTGARHWLAAALPENGYANARALAALGAADPLTVGAPGGHYTITLNGDQLLDQPLGEVLTTTGTLHVSPDQLRERDELTATSSGTLFLRYRLTTPAPAAAPHDGGIALLRDYLDPQSRQPLDLARLRVGQLVRARLTVVTTEPRRFVAIADPLPANALISSADASGDFEYVGRAGDHLTLTSAMLEPGVYQYSYLLRVAAAGRYGVPAPTGSAAGGASGAGNSVTIAVR